MAQVKKTNELTPNVLNTNRHVCLKIQFDTLTNIGKIRQELNLAGMQHNTRLTMELLDRTEQQAKKMGYELIILTTETSYKEELTRAVSVLKKHMCFIDIRCGFHIAIDCRYRNRMDVYMVLLEWQDFLFGISESDRRKHAHCIPNIPGKDPMPFNAIYPSDKYETINVKMFESSLMVDKLVFFVKTVLGIINFNVVCTDTNKHV